MKIPGEKSLLSLIIPSILEKFDINFYFYTLFFSLIQDWDDEV